MYDNNETMHLVLKSVMSWPFFKDWRRIRKILHLFETTFRTLTLPVHLVHILCFSGFCVTHLSLVSVSILTIFNVFFFCFLCLFLSPINMNIPFLYSNYTYGLLAFTEMKENHWSVKECTLVSQFALSFFNSFICLCQWLCFLLNLSTTLTKSQGKLTQQRQHIGIFYSL